MFNLAQIQVTIAVNRIEFKKSSNEIRRENMLNLTHIQVNITGNHVEFKIHSGENRKETYQV